MSGFITRALAVATFAAALMVAAPASASLEPQKFATFKSIGDAPTIEWTQAPGLPLGRWSTPDPGSTPNATLTFLPGPYLPVDLHEVDALGALAAYGDIPASLIVSGGGQFSYRLGGGTGDYWEWPPAVQAIFTFLYAGESPLVFEGVEYFKGANLLTAKVTYLSVLGGPLLNASYTSDFGYVDQFRSVLQGGDTTLSVDPIFRPAHYWPSVDNYSAQISGYFTGGVPEPSIWAMMIAGFGLAGTALRRARPKALVSA